MTIVPIKRPRPPAPSTEPFNRPDVVARVRVRQPAIRTETSAAPRDTPETLPEPTAQQPISATPGTDDSVEPYQVGYRHPPKHTQFRKGQSGNPKGRPKGAKSFNTIVRETLQTKLQIRTAKGRKTVTQIQALMLQTIESALKGSRQDRHELLRYYRDAVPEEVKVASVEAAATNGDPQDIDAHDRAILDRLRATIIADLEGE